MAKARITYLSAAEKDFVHEKTLEVLANVGVAYNTPQAIDLLAAGGRARSIGRPCGPSSPGS